MLFSVFQVNVFVEAWCALFSLVGLVCVALFSRSAQRSAHWYRRSVSLMFIFNMICAVSDGTAGLFRGVMTATGWYATHVGNALSYASLFLLGGAFTSYLCARLEESGDTTWWSSVVWAMCAVGIALTLSGVFYVIDPVTNLYHRTQYFWVSQAMGVFIQIGNLVVLMAKHRLLRQETAVSMLIYIMLPVIALVAQMHVYGLSLTQMATTAALMVVFVDLQMFLAQSMAKQQEFLAQRDRELNDSRVQIMVSQIQPHFLYNTLDAIYYLCGKDPAKAREAISRFSDYLRANLRSLRTTTPVPFATELEHVQNYLELEQMSSDDTINFVMDVQTTSFMLPALSLQPLVENAVKHGVTKRVEGGTITLRTRETPTSYEVTVEDDGVGFNPLAELDNSRPHVGMQNVRQRLESMCGGTLTVTSEPGTGTTAVVSIPKGGKNA